MRTLVINLDRCPDRLATVMEELSRCGLTGERVPAIDGQLLPLDSNGNIPGFKGRGKAGLGYYRGAAGCYFSHCKALHTAISGDIWPCLIVEDDIQYVGDSGHIILPDTDKDVIYLGGMEQATTGRIYGGHAICYKTKAAALSVLHFAENHPNMIDGVFVRLQKLTNMYHYHRPWQFIQRSGISTITGTYMPRERMTSEPATSTVASNTQTRIITTRVRISHEPVTLTFGPVMSNN